MCQWVVYHYSLSWALLFFSALNQDSKQVTQISPWGMLPTSTVRVSPGMRVKQLSARFMGRQFSFTLRQIHTQVANFLVAIVRERPWKEQVSPGSALVLFFMGTKKQLLELTTLSRVRRSILMKALCVKLAYSVLLKRWTSARSNGLTVFSTVCLILVAYPAKVMMASWQWQLNVLLQSFTIYVTQSPVALSWMVWMISCSQEFLTLQWAALYVPKQSTVAHEVTGQTSFNCQQRLPMLQGLLRRRVVIAISRAYDCMTWEKQAIRVVLEVGQLQLKVQPGIKMCPLGWRSCRRITQLSLLEGQYRSSARVNLCSVDISGNPCIPYSELNRPTYSQYSSIGVPAPHTLQKWISPEERVLVEEEETEGDVSQQYTSGCSSLRTFGRTPLKTSEYICQTSFF